MGRPLGYLIFSLMAFIRDPIQRVLGANPAVLQLNMFSKFSRNSGAAPDAQDQMKPTAGMGERDASMSHESMRVQLTVSS